MNNILLEIKKLREDISLLDRLYEAGDNTILEGKYISDSEYDEMYLKLVSLENKNPEFFDKESPTQKIVLETVDALNKVEHSTPMLSQEKITTVDEVVQFATKSHSDIVVEDKLDGLTILATYDQGKIVKAVTRGNGYIGEDVTHNYKAFSNTPIHIPFKGKLEVRMEAMVPYEEFNKINVDGRYSNPRNLASGTVRQLDASITKERGLIAIAFDLIDAEGMDFKSDIEMLEFLKNQGFHVVNHKVYKNNKEGVEELVSFIKKYEEDIRPNLKYMVDGLVLKFIDIQEREKMGYTAKFPRWATAFKFKSEESSTLLKDVVWQVGKTGQITPVAILDEVEIGDVNIARATLHNYKNIKNKDIRIGDQVVVARANDVIPQIVKPLKELRTGEEFDVEIPTKCPSCKSVVEQDGDILFCTGINCKPQIQKKIEHFVSRDAMNITGLGEKAIQTFFNHGIMENFLDIYHLKDKRKQICSLERFGPKKVDNLIAAVEKSKDNTLDRVLYGLSINHVGSTASKAFAKEFKSMDSIITSLNDIEAFKSRLRGLEDFGDKTIESVLDFFKNDSNIEIIERLKSEGLSMVMPEESKENISEKIKDKTFVITGKVEHFKNRKEIKELIESKGGVVRGSVSNNTDYLINNDTESNSSKNKKAKELGVLIINEKDFLDMVEN